MAWYTPITAGMAHAATALTNNFAPLVNFFTNFDENGNAVSDKDLTVNNLTVNGTTDVAGMPDCNWTAIPLSSGYSGALYYRCVAGHVDVQIDGVAGFPDSGIDNACGFVPEPYRPTRYERVVGAFNNSGTVLVTIAPSGAIYISVKLGQTITRSGMLTINLQY